MPEPMFNVGDLARQIREIPAHVDPGEMTGLPQPLDDVVRLTGRDLADFLWWTRQGIPPRCISIATREPLALRRSCGAAVVDSPSPAVEAPARAAPDGARIASRADVRNSASLGAVGFSARAVPPLAGLLSAIRGTLRRLMSMFFLRV